MGLSLGVRSQLLKTKLGDGSLDTVRDLGVDSEALSNRASSDLAQGGVQGVDQLGRRGSEV